MIELDEIDSGILRILIKKRRKLKATTITKLLNEKKIKISRPTVIKRLKKLRNRKLVLGYYRYNPEKLHPMYK